MIVWIYTLFFIFLGCSAAVWGGWLEHAGPRKAGVLCAVCCVRGVLCVVRGASCLVRGALCSVLPRKQRREPNPVRRSHLLLHGA